MRKIIKTEPWRGTTASHVASMAYIEQARHGGKDKASHILNRLLAFLLAVAVWEACYAG